MHESYETYHCNLCAAETDRLHQSEHWDGSLLMLCRACATEHIDPYVRGINAANPDAFRHRADQIADRELQRRRAELEADEAYLAECRPLLAEKTRLMRALQEDDLSDADRFNAEFQLRAIRVRLDRLRHRYDTARGTRDTGLSL